MSNVVKRRLKAGSYPDPPLPGESKPVTPAMLIRDVQNMLDSRADDLMRPKDLLGVSDYDRGRSTGLGEASRRLADVIRTLEGKG